MKIHTITILISLVLIITSCFKEIDTVPILRTVDKTFVVEHSIKKFQSYYRFYENTVALVDTVRPSNWDLAFESAGEGSRVLLGWASASTAVKTGLYNMNDLTQDYILDLLDSDDWTFDDPAYINTIDSVSLRNWEDGEIYLHNRGIERDNYYVIQFVSKDESSYTFRYASAISLENVNEVIVNRSSGFNYIYFSYKTNDIVYVEPNNTEWDILFSPYLGWWETLTPGEFAPYIQSGVLINNEKGVRIAHVFDPDILFEDIDSSFITNPKYEFTDMKGAIGSNWKILGETGSENLYNMDPDKKYLLRKYDFETSSVMYFKLQIIDYRLNGIDHHPTVEFKFLGSQ